MLAAILALALAPATRSSDLIPLLERCGIRREQIRIDDDYGGEDIPRVSGARSPTVRTTKCLVSLAHQHGVFVEFIDRQAMRAFADQSRPLWKAWGVERARAALAAQGLLNKAPMFRSGAETPAGFAHRAERFCGVPTGSLADPEEHHRVAARPGSPDFAPGGKGTTCFFNVLAAAGVDLGFVGNAAWRDGADRSTSATRYAPRSQRKRAAPKDRP